MPYPHMQDRSIEDQVQHILVNRFFALKGHALKHGTRLDRRWNTVDRFIMGALDLPGFDVDALLESRINMIRVNSMVYGPDTTLFIPSVTMGVSNSRMFLARKARGSVVHAVVNSSRFCVDYAGLTSSALTTAYWRIADKDPYATMNIGGWEAAFHQFERDELVDYIDRGHAII